MTDLQAAAAAVGSLRAAFDLTKTMLDIAGSVKVQAKVIELQREILSAQSSAMSAQNAQAALLERIHALEKEIVRLNEWDGAKDQYKLQQIGNGALAYVYKADPGSAEPPHWLCPTCFDKRQRGYLVSIGRGTGSHGASMNIWQCQTCKNSIQVHYARSPGKENEDKPDPSRTPGGGIIAF